MNIAFYYRDDIICNMKNYIYIAILVRNWNSESRRIMSDKFSKEEKRNIDVDIR